MRDRDIAPLLEALRSSNSRESWTEFLSVYSPILYQSARVCTSSEDAAADCYLYICEKLAHNRFRRLLKFKPQGSATFTTWLRVVARNLCFDWHRKQSGRQRPFKSLQNLSPLEMEVYTCRFLRSASPEETLARLEPLFPGVSLGELSNIEENLQRSLSSRQQWILSSRKAALTTAVAVDEDVIGAVEVADPSPNQEDQIVREQQYGQLKKSLASLPAGERLLVQLRFEQDLSLEEIASLCDLGDAQRVHRRMVAILKQLRGAMC